jgi:hypothetical protein
MKSRTEAKGIVPSVGVRCAEKTGEEDESTSVDTMASDFEEDKDVKDDEVTEADASKKKNK